MMQLEKLLSSCRLLNYVHPSSTLNWIAIVGSEDLKNLMPLTPLPSHLHLHLQEISLMFQSLLQMLIQQSSSAVYVQLINIRIEINWNYY